VIARTVRRRGLLSACDGKRSPIEDRAARSLSEPAFEAGRAVRRYAGRLRRRCRFTDLRDREQTRVVRPRSAHRRAFAEYRLQLSAGPIYVMISILIFMLPGRRAISARRPLF
jgi:hypothetical protein